MPTRHRSEPVEPGDKLEPKPGDVKKPGDATDAVEASSSDPEAGSGGGPIWDLTTRLQQE